MGKMWAKIVLQMLGSRWKETLVQMMKQVM